MYFGSPLYIILLLIPFAAVAVLRLALCKRSDKTTEIVILVLMLFNVLQHIFKHYLYPQYRGREFSIYATAYNMCSVLILIGPLVLKWGNRFFKNFLYFVGSAAGIGAISFPFWFFGVPAEELGWDFVRFYLCHLLLFVTSVLPLVQGLHRPERREFWQIGAGFLLALCVILINDVIFVSMGYSFYNIEGDIYTQLNQSNPCMLMGPKAGFAWLSGFLECFSLPVFLGQNPAGCYAPILWYALPVYLGISGASLALFTVLERLYNKTGRDI